jgi:hypothetical protein
VLTETGSTLARDGFDIRAVMNGAMYILEVIDGSGSSSLLMARSQLLLVARGTGRH